MVKNRGCKNIISCRACRNDLLSDFYAVDDAPIAGIYYEDGENPLNARAPITLTRCDKCGLIQLRETIDSSIYLDYSFIGNSTASYEFYLGEFAKSLVEEWGVTGKRVFEIGASNGVLLRYVKNLGGNIIEGIEPSQKLCENAALNGVHLMSGFFNEEFVEMQQGRKYDCLIIRHVLEHIDNLQEMVCCLRRILEIDGLLVVEVPDVSAILGRQIFSNVFHEHLNYFSLDSLNALLAQYNFENVFNQCVDIHGGSIMAVYRLKVGLPLESVESSQVMPRVLEIFAKSAQVYYAGLLQTVRELTARQKVVHGYGASHRTFVLMGNSGLDVRDIPVVYDNNVFLQHKRMNGIGTLVLSPSEIAANDPDVIVIFATSYENEIVNFLRTQCKYSGKIISAKGGNGDGEY